MRNRRKSCPIVGIDDEPRHFIGLVGDDEFVQKCRKRQVGQRILCGYTFLAGFRRNSRELVAAA